MVAGQFSDSDDSAMKSAQVNTFNKQAMNSGAYGAVDTVTMNGAQVNGFNREAMNDGAYDDDK